MVLNIPITKKKKGSVSDYKNYEHQTIFIPLLKKSPLITKSSYKMKYTLGLLIFWTSFNVHTV